MSTLRRYQIKPGTNSLWSIFTDDGQQIAADQDFRHPREALGHLGAIARAEGLAMTTKQLPDQSVFVEFVVPGTLLPPREAYMLTLEMTPEIHDALGQMSKDTGQDLSEVIRSALGMYKLAVEAHKSGKAVGISDKPESMQTKFF